MESNFCPLLKVAGYINGREECNENCALYVAIDEERGGCALAVIAKSMVSLSEEGT